MSEWIEVQNGLYALHTAHTSYLFRILPSGHAEHLYYGARLPVTPGLAQAIAPRWLCSAGHSAAYSEADDTLCLDRLCLEAGTEGKGDLGTPLVRLTDADGASTLDFVFDHAERPDPAQGPAGLPGACDADDALTLVLRETERPGLTLSLHYAVFAAADVIARWTEVTNGTDRPLSVHALGSAQLDYSGGSHVFTAFHGAWADEMHRCDTLLCGSTVTAESRGVESSASCNPCTMLAQPGATEDAGCVYGMNLLYSGSHRTIAEPGRSGRLRWSCGIQPEGFCWALAPGETLASPQAVLSWSSGGYGGLSRQWHAFVRRHIVRGVWRDRPRPVLVNSWEAFYFKFDESRLLKLADAAAACGVELFVLDDGWFGARDSDRTSLGDWAPNAKKLPHGLGGLAQKLRGMGLSFGIWVEPEMVNTESELYRAHPDWAMAVPGRAHSEGRHQRILDLCNPDVRRWMIDTLSALLRSAEISYVKWDMNRPASDLFSPWLGAARQGEVALRYQQGLCEVLAAVTAAFPDILFESCASGGSRGDLGMLCYMPQFWASDNTDPVQRAQIQTGYSYGYPLSCLGCHVSASPCHQTQRRTPWETRFAAAACGALGYELDFTMLNGEEKKQISEQIALYKELRPWLQQAAYYRVACSAAAPVFAGGPAAAPDTPFCWCAVAPDRSRALGVELTALHGMTGGPFWFRMPGLDPAAEYHFTGASASVDIRTFGSLINTMSPVRMRPDGVLAAVAAKFVHPAGDREDAVLSGAALGAVGAALSPTFCGTGYAEGMRTMPDFSSRLYFAERLDAALPAGAQTAGAQTAGAQAAGARAAETEKAPAGHASAEYAAQPESAPAEKAPAPAEDPAAGSPAQ
jgi:alpha-galactosidase